MKSTLRFWKKCRTWFYFSSLIFFVGCGIAKPTLNFGSVEKVSVTPSLSYNPPNDFIVATGISVDQSPTVVGSMTSFKVEPTLPAGLSLDATTGRITGTPTVPSVETAYVVTATGVDGTSSVTLNFDVAQGYVVNSLSDFSDAANDGVCEATVGLGDCTLRAAVAESANYYLSNPSIRSYISIPAGTINLGSSLMINSRAVVRGVGVPTVINPSTSGILILGNADISLESL